MRRTLWIPALLLALRVGAATDLAVAPAPEPADLKLHNRFIITLRAGLLGITPAGRVTGIEARLQDAIDHHPSGEVAAVEIPEGFLVTIGGESCFRIFKEDVDPLGNDTPEVLRDRTLANLRTAMAEIEEMRSFPRFMRALGQSVLATVLLLLFLYGLRRFGRWLRPRLEAASASRVHRVGSGELADEALARMLRILRGALISAGWVTGVIAIYLWLVGVLEAFPYTRPWGVALGSSLVSVASSALKAIAGAVPGLFYVAVILLVTRSLIGLVGRFFDGIESGQLEVRGLHRDTIPATRRITTVLMWLFAFALAYPFVPGSKSAAFQGVTVFAGLMITIGSGAFVGHVLAGYMIVYSRSLREGDYVRLGDDEGTVESIGLFTTKLRTVRQEVLSIPHSVVFASSMTNYTLDTGPNGLLLQTTVTIGYGAPWRQVESILLRAAAATEELEKEPPPYVRQRSLSDFYVEYALFAYLKRPERRLAVLSKLHAAIQDSFNEAGVQIMSPHYEADPHAPVLVPKSGWDPEGRDKKG